MDDQKSIENKGATMRLGACPCFKKRKLHNAAYEKEEVSERHRHRFEFNNTYKDKMEDAGLIDFWNKSTERDLVEIVEVKNHPWYVGVQFHPEFQSKPNKAHPLFACFIEAAN